MSDTSQAYSEIFSTQTRHGFNENHLRSLRVKFQYIDQTLAEVERIMASADSPSLFEQYTPDTTPIQRKVAHGYVARIRDAIRRVINELEVPTPRPHCGALWAARTQLMGVSLTLDELRPRYMRGYGALSEQAGQTLEAVYAELRALTAKLENYLTEGAGENLQVRLQRLEQTTDEVRLLRELERIITAHGLVEFRGALSTLLDRLEAPTFEVGVFGRVSSGKSSLLNHLLGDDYLPVGVTPVTALPTRIQYGKTPQAIIEFAEREPLTAGLSRLAEFCAEQNNPGNEKHVARVRVELPATSLREGVTFVDTPGLGSLAVAGAEETAAYLPRCDLGIMLVDAAATLTHEDLAVIEALYRSGATAMVLLSKADLLAPDERKRVIEYVRHKVQEQMQVDLPVHLVSVRGADVALCDQWLAGELAPLLDRHKELSAAALKRKVGALREAVTGALQRRFEHKELPDNAPALQALRDGETLLEAAERNARDVGRDMSKLVAPILANVTEHARDGDLSSCFTAAASAEIARTTAVSWRQLEELRSQLVKALQTAEQAAGATGPEDLPALRELPGLDLAPVIGGLNGTHWPATVRWSAGLRQHWLREQIEDPLSDALNRYGQRLRHWARETVDGLRKAFTARADVCRAQLEGTGDVDASCVAEDIRRLEQWGAFS
jgi:GTP-binding protein EngB required for normal cell division